MNTNTSGNNKWNVDRTVRFLQIYEKNPCLWDPKNESYRNRDVRKQAYERIAHEMALEDFGVMEVRAKIRSLRNAYTLELAKILRRKKSTLVTNYQKQNLAWFPIADRFFSKVIHIGEQPSQDQDTLGKNSSERRQYKELYTNRVSGAQSYSSTNLGAATQEEIDNEPYTVPRASTRTSTDEFDVFGNFIANELRSVKDKATVRNVKRKIQRALLDMYEPPTVLRTASHEPSPANSIHVRSDPSDEENEINVTTIRRPMLASDASTENMNMEFHYLKVHQIKVSK